MRSTIGLAFVMLLWISVWRCSLSTSEKDEVLVEKYCGSCHLTPNPEYLPKHIWEEKVLPEMGARLGIYINNYDPLKKLSWSEKAVVAQRNYYPSEALLSQKEWKSIYNYIVSHAPDTLIQNVHFPVKDSLRIFEPTVMKSDYRPGAITTFIGNSQKNGYLHVGNGFGEVVELSPREGFNLVQQVNSTPVSYIETAYGTYLIDIGQMTPTEISSGNIYKMEGKRKRLISNKMHRPVFMEVLDLNDDGVEEMLVSEFGHFIGQLSIVTELDSSAPNTRALTEIPGIVKTHCEDINGDGMMDILFLATQGDESFRVLYQKEGGLDFEEETLLRFPAIWGSSWFEYADMNNDGVKDVVVGFGDNADYSHTPKPYHGVRIYLGDSDGTFAESKFIPFNGATKVACRDFDLDGDQDMVVSSFFPNFSKLPATTFLYLENTSPSDLTFTASTCVEGGVGKWMVMDAFDYDGDGDEDIAMGSLSYPLTPVPKEIRSVWENVNNDILLLENKTK